MHPFDVLGDPVRRRILELLADGEQPSGAVTEVVRREFGISQPAVSRHLRVLRGNGFARVRAEGTRRLYAVDDRALREVDEWLDRFRRSRDGRPGLTGQNSQGSATPAPGLPNVDPMSSKPGSTGAGASS